MIAVAILTFIVGIPVILCASAVVGLVDAIFGRDE